MEYISAQITRSDGFAALRKSEIGTTRIHSVFVGSDCWIPEILHEQVIEQQQKDAIIVLQIPECRVGAEVDMGYDLTGVI